MHVDIMEHCTHRLPFSFHVYVSLRVISAHIVYCVVDLISILVSMWKTSGQPLIRGHMTPPLSCM